MQCSHHAWTGPAAERKAASNGAAAPAPAGHTWGLRRRRSMFRSSACSCSSSGSHPHISPPHPTLCLQLTPVHADGYIRARWHILWTCPGPHLPAPGPTYVPCACRTCAPCWMEPMTPHGLPTHPRPHLHAPRPYSRHTKQVAFFIWHLPPNHLPQNSLWILLCGVL